MRAIQCGARADATTEEPGAGRRSLCATWLRQPVFLGIMLLATVSFGQEAGAPRDPVLTSLGDRASLFFESLSLEKSPEAFQELLAGSALLKREDDLRQLVAQTAQLPTKYGRYRGAEQIGARRAGQDLVLLRYLAKHDQCPVVWSFVFYRPPQPAGTTPAGTTPAEPEAWRIVSIDFHTEWERLWD